MSKIKTAYELACERVIVSKPKKKMKILNVENESSDFEMPEFVECWKHPEGPQKYETMVLEEDGSNSTVSMIDNYNSLSSKKIDSKKKEINTHNSEVKVQEAYSVSFDHKSDPSVHWYGHFTSYTGFSRMNRAFAFGLSNKGIRVKLDIQESSVDVNEETAKQIHRMSQTQVSPSAPKIFGATVPLNMFHGGKKILYTMMETSCTLHDTYVGKLNLFDEIWVPTHFAKDLFKQNGVNPPIQVMPLGVDTKRYNPDLKDFNFGQDLNKFVFLSVFKWGYRKGYDVLIKSFMEEFSSDDNVTLLLVSRCESPKGSKQIFEDFNAVRQSVNKKDEDLPHVALYDKETSERDMPSIYGAADAFCLISRGEGWGLPFCEAGASGMPVIASNCSGQTEFLNENNSFLVDPTGYSTAEVNGNLSKLAKHCLFYENQKFPDFGREAIEQTKQHMRYVFENYESSLEKADQLRTDLVNNYTWSKSVDRICHRILDIS